MDIATDAKACTACGIVKPISCFYTNYGKPRWSCKDCSKASARKWLDGNRDTRRATQKRLYYKYMSTSPEYAEKKRRRCRDYMRTVRLTEDRKQYDRDYSARERRKDPVKYLIRAAKFRASKRDLPFDLTIEWARQRWTGNCELTGIAFETQSYAQGPRSPSIDKILPRAGYTQDNCRFVLSAVNSMKGNGSDAEMMFIARALIAGDVS